MNLTRILFALLICLPAVDQLAAAEKEEAKPSVIPVFTIRGSLGETPSGADLLFGSGAGESLKDLTARLRKAAEDERVPAIVLLLGEASLDPAQIEEIRAALSELQAADKLVHAHADAFTMTDYLLLSGASELTVVPTGDIWVTGLAAESPYLRGLLEKVGIEPDFFTCGAYKSAGEMFMRTGPSPEAAENLEWLIDGIFETYVDLIASGRGVEEEVVRQWIDQGLFSAAQAREAGLIDEVEYRQEFAAGLRERYGEDLVFDKRYGKKKRQEIDFSSPFGVMKFYMDLLSGARKTKSRRDAVAIVYVDGAILPGSGSPGGFPFGSTGMAFSTPIRKALDEAADDDSVKAVVLRVNSPGGSAVASEIILQAAKRVKAKKPLVVSMGGVAGSGGYYVACGADTIFADRSTITGSIGVVVGKLATSGLWDKIGVQWKTTKRGTNATILSSNEVFSESQRKLLEEWMQEVYQVFQGHVTAIRGERLKQDIEQLAGGRVYTGQQALELGLVDRLGGLDAALAEVAQQANLESYEVRVIPPPKDFFELLMEDLIEPADDPSSIRLANRGVPSDVAAVLRAAWPLLEKMDPQRARGIMQALQQLGLLQQERVLLTMPIIQIRD